VTECLCETKRAWGSNFSLEEIAEARDRCGLLTMELELSRECNLRCIYCYSEAGAPLNNELSSEEIYSVVDQAIDLGARRVIVLGGGEPLVYPGVMDIMRYLHKRGVGIDLFTNGTLITENMAREFRDLGVHPVIKMNSLNDDVQDLLAGHKGAARDIRQGFKNLVKAGYPAEGLPMGVQSVICRQNLAELPAMWSWIRERGMTPYFEMITLQGRARKHPELEVTPGELRAAFEDLSRLDRERFGFDWEPHPPVAGLRCNRHSYTCTVTVHGDVIPCPGVDIPVGNIRTQPLADILKGSEVIHKLRNIRKYIKGACAECPQNDICYGCRGMAYQLTGDYLAADPLCWHVNQGK
jgi:radical SAM protein with 4Fe4S-binding SPASM domain